jgi:hypothetical protein
MRRLAFAIVLMLVGRGAAGWAQAQDQRLIDNGYNWAVGGANGGVSSGWSGGELRAAIVEDGNKRRPGPAQRTDVSVVVGKTLEPAMQEWLRAALDGESPGRDIDFVELNYNKSARSAVRYPGAKITEIVFAPMGINDRITYGDD